LPAEGREKKKRGRKKKGEPRVSLYSVIGGALVPPKGKEKGRGKGRGVPVCLCLPYRKKTEAPGGKGREEGKKKGEKESSNPYPLGENLARG